MFNLKKVKNAFTLAETLIVASIFAIMVIGIVLGINRAFTFMNNTKVLVRATNFAREGVEMVYNIRDTNRRKCSGEKDKNRLYVGGQDACKDITSDNLMKEGIYVIKEGKNGENDSYMYAEWLTGSSDDFYNGTEGFFSPNNSAEREASKIEFNGTYSYYSGGDIATGSLKDLLEGSVEFYRVLRVYGIFKKDVEDTNVECLGDCLSDGTPAEMRFCVKVFYAYNGGHHSSELCSLMTNFEE